MSEKQPNRKIIPSLSVGRDTTGLGVSARANTCFLRLRVACVEWLPSLSYAQRITEMDINYHRKHLLVIERTVTWL